MKMAETQSVHRMDLEKTVITSQQNLEARGQWFGLVIALSFGFGGVYAALNGQPWFGAVMVGSTVASLVGIFVYSKKQSEKELSEKRTKMMPKAPPQSAPNEPKAPQVAKL
jgi:hypothetical protein